MASTAWILGAGFSRGLLGPLLNDLLAPAARERLRATYPTDSGLHDAVEASACFSVFETGKGSYWQHAEEFLVEVDRAAHDEPSVLASMVPPGVSSAALRAAARRIVAAQCCSFLKGVTKEHVSAAEMWRPYMNWARQLSNNDVVITFNYDRVLESMTGGPIADLYGNGFTVITDESKVHRSRMAGSAPILKLHGSVSWRADDRQGEWGFVETNDAEFALRCEPAALCIGTPGRAKSSAMHRFRGLWSIAKQELAQASEVYVIGYSFPDSDGHPAMDFLDSLRQNPIARRLRVVVGSDSQTQERIRYHFQGVATVEIAPVSAERFFQSWIRGT